MGLDCDQERIPPNIIFSFFDDVGRRERDGHTETQMAFNKGGRDMTETDLSRKQVIAAG